jgi:catechol 2,3-dioxygenase-like lactoylglutathione lyase family enzyme
MNTAPGHQMQDKAENHLTAKIALLKSLCPLTQRCETPVIKAQRLAYVIFQRPDLQAAEKFFSDFGLRVESRDDDTLYFRGNAENNITLVVKQGPHNMLGLGMVADSRDLDYLAAHTGNVIHQRLDALGGSFISLCDPCGLTVEVCTNLRALAPVLTTFVATPWNGSDDKQRLSTTVRNKVETHRIEKLGHSVIGVSRIKPTVEWYQEMLGMITSDLQFIQGEPLPVLAFLRFDTGKTPSDHHSIGIASLIETGHVHTAFEMNSMEELAIGGEWLRHKGYKHSWGIGRHILGSQIFDYWREPDGDLFEHYCDGDVFDSAVTTGYHLLHGKAQHQWGPAQTKDFTGEDKPWNNIKALFRRIPSNDDLSIARVRRMLAALKQ